MFRLRLSLFFLVAIVSGCATLPSDGPQSSAIIQASHEIEEPAEDVGSMAYDLVRLNHVNINGLPAVSSAGGRANFSLPKAVSSSRVAVGDTLAMTLWEDAEVNLLSSSGERVTELKLVVDADGFIQVPYAGRLRAAGRSVSAIRRNLVDKYSTQTINPEITLSLVASEARAATVLGDVKNGGRVALPLQGLTLLELIASAGGIQEPPWEVDVKLIKGGREQTVRMNDILRTSRNNVMISPGDIVHVTHTPRLFTVMGAVKTPGSIEVPSEEVTLLDVLSAADGLETGRADPSAVFVYRKPRAGQHKPKVYLLDLEQADSLFLGEKFVMAHDDIVYVGTADAVTFNRFIRLIFSPLSRVSNTL